MTQETTRNTTETAAQTSDQDNDAEYEYRLFGCTKRGWCRTEWTAREDAAEEYEEAAEDWEMVCVQRRVEGEEDTLERRPKPDEGKWVLVTKDDVHPADEDVAAPPMATELRIDLNAMESEVIEDYLDYGLENTTFHDDGDLVVANAGEETKQELVEHCYERAREADQRHDSRAAQWCRDAAGKVERAEVTPVH